MSLKKQKEGGAMLVGVRKKHWLLLSLSMSGLLLLLVYSVKPNTPLSLRPLENDVEVGFLHRRITNDGELTAVGVPPPVLAEPSDLNSVGSHKEQSVREQSLHDSSFSKPNLHIEAPVEIPASLSSTAQGHLTSTEKRNSLAKEGVLLVKDLPSMNDDSQQESINQKKQESKQNQNDKETEKQGIQPQSPNSQHQHKEQTQKQQQKKEQLQIKQHQQQQQTQQKEEEEHLQQAQQKQQEKKINDWQKQLRLQNQELLRQRYRLQEQHLQKQQLLQKQLKQQEMIENQQKTLSNQDSMVDTPHVNKQNVSLSVVSKTSQVSQDVTVGGSEAQPRNTMPDGGPVFHTSYENLRKMGDNLVRYTIRRDFMNSKPDTFFTPGEIVSPSQVRRVAIVSTWRSGSSFLGDILRSYPGTFFSFEPLHHLLKNLHLQEGPLVEDVIHLLRSILTCDYSELDEYVNYMRDTPFLITHNTRLWNSCARNRALCFDKSYISSVCRYMPVNVLKTVRMGLGPIVDLLLDPALDLRVIHLVRDPRGSLHSRMQLSWCHSQACSDPETVCKDLQIDLNLSLWLKEKFPDRYLMVRYEDLGLHPEKKAREIFKFLQLSYHKSVAAFVKDHTSLSRRPNKKVGTYSTYRDSKVTTFAWRTSLNYTTVEGIQEVCEKPLNFLKLRVFQNEDEYLNTTLPVLVDS